MSTIATNNITDAAGTGAPNFANGLKLGTAGVLGPVIGNAPMFACRAWVNFNGTGTVAIRASGNVSSITDNGTGDYTVNFTNPMPDANYGYFVTHNGVNSGGQATQTITANKLVSAVRLTVQAGGVGVADTDQINVAIFR